MNVEWRNYRLGGDIMDAMDLVGYIITYSKHIGNLVTNLRLQKLLYFIQKEHLQQHGEPAFDDDICAWQYGPVVPRVYYEFSRYASTPIINIDESTPLDDSIKNTIRTVLNKYNKVPTWKLVQLTHEPNSPWSNTVEEGGTVIPCNYIRTLEN